MYVEPFVMVDQLHNVTNNENLMSQHENLC